MYMPPAVNALARMCICTGLTVIGGTTQNGYNAEGTRLKTTLNRRGYSIPLTPYAWGLKIY